MGLLLLTDISTIIHYSVLGCFSPLTTPEEAQAFLANMRDKSHQREFLHKPPTHLSADGMDHWHMQQRKKEQELRQRRKEAEQLLRGYRGGSIDTPRADTLDDPKSVRHYTYNQPQQSMQETVYGDENVQDPLLSSRSVPTTQPSFQVDIPARPATMTNKSRNNNLHFHHNHQHADEKKDYTEYSQPQSCITKPADSFAAAASAPTTAVVGSETVWRDCVGTEKFPVQSGRYHVYLSYACPGSHRALIVRALKGLEECVSVTYVHPTWRLTNPGDEEDKHRGWYV
jgi:hypothetical protein